MKNTRSKLLQKKVETICDFNQVRSNHQAQPTFNPTPTDPTSVTATIITTTVSTQRIGKMLI